MDRHFWRKTNRTWAIQSNVYVYYYDITRNKGSRCRGKHAEEKSRSVLDTREPYIFYRVALYDDGFRKHNSLAGAR